MAGAADAAGAARAGSNIRMPLSNLAYDEMLDVAGALKAARCRALGRGQQLEHRLARNGRVYGQRQHVPGARPL
jgi:hypothetical protein